MSDSLEQRVARGAAWLDDQHPGWRDQISLDNLDLYSNTQCILGQVFGWQVGIAHLVDTHLKTYQSGTRDLLGALGFNAENAAYADRSPGEMGAETRSLVAEWRRVIHAARQPVEQREAQHV